MEIFKKLYKFSKDQCYSDILSYYKNHGSVIINYIYSTIFINAGLLNQGKIIGGFNLKDVVMDSDFVLPDGAALKTLWKCAYIKGLVEEKSIDNLNGTDFLPYFLNKVVKEYGIEQVSVCALTVYDSRLGKPNPQGFLQSGVHQYLGEFFGFTQIHVEEIEYSNSNYVDFDWSGVRKFIKQNPTKIRLFLNFRGSPYQELFAFLNREEIAELGLLCFNQGATVDYRLGLEKRAPRIIRVLWLESIWRVAIHPKKNGKKFLTAFKMMWECVNIIFGKK